MIADAGMIPGIKVDVGAKDMAAFPGENITEGLDGLRERLQEYSKMGAHFAKWRAVIAVGDGIPSSGCIDANAQALARYAALCQEAGLVPVVEPEVLMTGDHSLDRCLQLTKATLQAVFNHLYVHRVMLEGMILKANMVLPGLACPQQEAVREVAVATVTCLLQSVPAAIPGVAFLSGGQSCELASARLNAMNQKSKSRPPWPGFLVCSRDSAAGPRDLEGTLAEHNGGTERSSSSRSMQSSSTPGRLHCRDGRDFDCGTCVAGPRTHRPRTNEASQLSGGRVSSRPGIVCFLVRATAAVVNPCPANSHRQVGMFP